MRNLRIAELLFNRPLMVSESKLNVILHALGPRFNLDMTALPQADLATISDQERSRAGYKSSGGIGIIGIYGPLMHRVMASDYPSGGPTTYAEIKRAFDLAMVDDSVQSIVLDIDSPGGEVHGAFDLADHIFQSRGNKLITAVVNESAYSAAYLLASSADRIVIPRTGGVGSIGVIATHADFSRAEDEAGITVTHVYAGSKKADFSPHQPLGDEAHATLQGMVNDTYELFCDTVGRNRRISVKNIKATEAGIYEGKKAVSAGLADEVQAADKAIVNARGKSRSMITATKSTLHTNKKEDHMNLESLKENHPDLVSQIEADARQGMVAQADVTAAAAAEQTRVCSLATAMFGEEPGKKLSAVAAKGLSAEDVATLGLTYDSTAGVSEADATSRAAILKGLQTAAPEGLKGVQPASGTDADRSAAAKGIAAGCQK
jgi:signal peptide peptidase SppA